AATAAYDRPAAGPWHRRCSSRTPPRGSGERLGDHRLTRGRVLRLAVDMEQRRGDIVMQGDIRRQQRRQYPLAVAEPEFQAFVEVVRLCKSIVDGSQRQIEMRPDEPVDDAPDTIGTI